MKAYKTSNWRDISEVEITRMTEDAVWFPPKDPTSEYEIYRNERKKPKRSDQVNYWETKEEARNFLIQKLTSEIVKYEQKILKAKKIIETLIKHT